MFLSAGSTEEVTEERVLAVVSETNQQTDTPRRPSRDEEIEETVVRLSGGGVLNSTTGGPHRPPKLMLHSSDHVNSLKK